MLCNVTGTLYTADGEPAAYKELRFTRGGVYADGSAVVVPQTQVEATDGSGALNINLYSGTYSVRARGVPPFRVTVPASASASLQSIIS